MEFIKELLLDSEVNVGYIGEVEDILEIADNLIDDGVTIYFDDEKEFEDIIEDNYILQITKIICEDCGKVEYFIEEVFDEDGYTIPDDSLTVTYVDEEILDCIEYTALDTEIVPVEFEEYDEDEEDFECDDEDLGLALTEELLSSLSEIDTDDAESIVELIADKLNEAFEMGYQEGLDSALEEVKDTVDAIKSLRVTEE